MNRVLNLGGNFFSRNTQQETPQNLINQITKHLSNDDTISLNEKIEECQIILTIIIDYYDNNNDCQFAMAYPENNEPSPVPDCVNKLISMEAQRNKRWSLWNSQDASPLKQLETAINAIKEELEKKKDEDLTHTQVLMPIDTDETDNKLNDNQFTDDISADNNELTEATFSLNFQGSWAEMLEIMRTEGMNEQFKIPDTVQKLVEAYHTTRHPDVKQQLLATIVYIMQSELKQNKGSFTTTSELIQRPELMKQENMATVEDTASITKLIHGEEALKNLKEKILDTTTNNTNTEQDLLIFNNDTNTNTKQNNNQPDIKIKKTGSTPDQSKGFIIEITETKNNISTINSNNNDDDNDESDDDENSNNASNTTQVSQPIEINFGNIEYALKTLPSKYEKIKTSVNALHQNFERSTQIKDTDNNQQDDKNTNNNNEGNTTKQITDFLQDAEVQSLAQNGLPRVIKIRQHNKQTQQQPNNFIGDNNNNDGSEQMKILQMATSIITDSTVYIKGNHSDSGETYWAKYVWGKPERIGSDEELADQIKNTGQKIEAIIRKNNKRHISTQALIGSQAPDLLQ